ncbi:MAG: peptidoglycan DD-metalloendopeptidase family protein [Deltaproteobacteria bacterium]|nr:peptidoglycan DD-metalloendopeptidase family protein [Deltaproteobacteria bacterium]
MKFLWYVACLVSVSGCAYLPIQDQHTVKKGETLAGIAHRYHLDQKKLAKLNGLEDIDHLLPAEMPIVKLSNRKSSYIKKAAYTMPSNRFIWPLQGELSSKFGRRWGTFHNGIDISSSFGTPIKSAAPGRVIYSGQEPGYGKLLIIYHGEAYSTVYAHASKLITKKGESVRRGQIIGYVGSTGRSTGPHLHFEIRRQKESQNPLDYLP